MKTKQGKQDWTGLNRIEQDPTGLTMFTECPCVSLQHAIECKEVSAAYFFKASIFYVTGCRIEKSYDFYAGFYANSCHIYHAIQEDSKTMDYFIIWTERLICHTSGLNNTICI